ncbi:MAG: N-acetyltransferase [Clostridiales bacterium]|nr:N-acetyltransferase [Clostridiales bacterium]
MNKITIRPEKPEDYEAISKLVYESFHYGTDYSDGIIEEKFVKEIRSKKYYIPELSFVAEMDKKMVGYFMLSHFPISNQHEDEFLILTPVAVDYRHLRQGIGKTMINLGLEKAREQGYKGVLVEGNPDFYHIFGFKISTEYGIYPSKEIKLPSPECLMVLELYKDGLAEIKGEVTYSMYEVLS